MTRLKYSIVIPSFRGFEGLKIIIPYILGIDRDDFEVIVSINHSEDANLTKEFLHSLSDKRLKIFTPTKKLPTSAHLDFAYSKSTALWVGHLGDDDLILKNRFNYIDKYSDTDNCDIIIGKDVRYVWPNNDFEPSNSTNSQLNFSHKINEVSGFKYYCKLLNEVVISAGGQWICRRSVYQKVYEKFGFFSPPNANGEFFALRAAARLSRKIILIDYPMFINGRMNKSSGNVLGEGNKKIFDWSFENPGWFNKANMPCANYIVVSYDSALRASIGYNERKYINKVFWARNFLFHFFSYKFKGSDIHNKRCNDCLYLIAIIKNFHFFLIIAIIRILISTIQKIFLPKKKNEISAYLNLYSIDINSITEFADYLKSKIDNKNYK